MNADTCAPGCEQWEVFIDSRGQTMIQYDYRTRYGELFSCVAYDVNSARKKRDAWRLKREEELLRDLGY